MSAYTTPTAYLQRFGADEAAQLLADEEQQLTTQLLRDAIAVAGGGSWTGTPSPEEQAAAQAALARLQRQIEIVSNFMDGYLRPAVALPLPAGDANAGTLDECCCALVRGGICDDTDNSTERIDKACDQWRAWLRDVSTGKTVLAGQDGGDVQAAGTSFRTGQAASGYDWDAFGGCR